jgi:hypothetical protein
MTDVEDDRPIDLEIRVANGGLPPRDSAMDAIEMGSPGVPWPRWWRSSVVGLVSVALVVGAISGYLFGTHRAGGKTATIAPVAVAPTTRLLVSGGGQPPTGTGNLCSVQLGDRLQLGIEVVNLSVEGATLLRADADLPMGGLRVTAIAWGSCGQLLAIDGASPYPLPAGTTVWLRMTFDVLTPCPGPLPVLFKLTYAQAGKVAVSDLGGFDDLGGIPYTGCSTSPN